MLESEFSYPDRGRWDTAYPWIYKIDQKEDSAMDFTQEAGMGRATPQWLEALPQAGSIDDGCIPCSLGLTLIPRYNFTQVFRNSDTQVNPVDLRVNPVDLRVK